MNAATTTPARLLPAVILALVAGALASLMFAPVLGLLVFVGLVLAIAARPRDAAIVLALMSPFYDVLVIRFTGIADIRILEILWLVAALSLAWRVWEGTERRFKAPPAWFTTGLVALVVWFLVTATMSGEGIRPIVETAQTFYLCVIAYVLAGVVAGAEPEELGRRLRPWAIVMAVVLAISLAGYVMGFQPVAQTVVTLPEMSVAYMADSPLVQGAGADATEISRLSALNLGPVGTAAMLVGVIAVASSFVFWTSSVKGERTAWLLLATASIVLLLTYSRAGWACALLAVVLILLAGRHRYATLVLALLVVVIAVVATLPTFASRIEEFTDTSEGSYQAHLRMWTTALHMIGERPVFGWGPGMFAEQADTLAINAWMAEDISADQPHNWILEIAAETGVLGGALAVAFVVTLLVITWRDTRTSPLPVFGLWVATGAYLVMNLTLNAFRTEMTWVWFGAMVGVAAWYKRLPAPVEGEDA